MKNKYINLGCGPVFVDTPEWLNLDFAPRTPAVKRANLLNRLPVIDETAELVYTSHFLEHVPRTVVPQILCECLRVLKPGGVLRLVVPDLENLAREYLYRRDNHEHQEANFVVLEMIDQCVRQVPGGELGNLYNRLGGLPRKDSSTIVDYIYKRTGEELDQPDSLIHYVNTTKPDHLIASLRNRLQRYWISLCLLMLPSAFRTQNVSNADIGERHQWLWDFHQMQTELRAVGFTNVNRCNANTSTILDFPFHPLDINHRGEPRKGEESMYIEARKPINDPSKS